MIPNVKWNCSNNTSVPMNYTTSQTCCCPLSMRLRLYEADLQFWHFSSLRCILDDQHLCLKGFKQSLMWANMNRPHSLSACRPLLDTQTACLSCLCLYLVQWHDDWRPNKPSFLLSSILTSLEYNPISIWLQRETLIWIIYLIIYPNLSMPPLAWGAP